MKFIIQLVLAFFAFACVFADKQSKLKQMEKELRENFSKSLGNQKTDEPDDPILQPEKDLNSNYQMDMGKAKILNYNLDIEVDFERELLEGTVVIEVETLESLAEMHLDAWNIAIEGKIYIDIPDYEIPVNNEEIKDWQDDIQINPNYGGAITMNFSNQIESYVRDKDGEVLDVSKPQPILPFTKFTLTMSFATLNNVDDLDSPARYSFVKAEHTHGKKAPFFYTQNTPIYGRTLFPCWDTPQSQTELHMKVKVKKELGMNIYSHYPKDEQTTEGDYTVATFNQQFPLVATHQIAIVVGKLEQRQIDDRIFILADDGETLDQAEDEFSELPLWINFTENIMGINYAWDRFEMVIMPPNYPYEGNQQQQLTYVSPSILGAGRTGKSVIFHEIASNYFGNYIQACNWQNVWLNEGISTYIERVSKSLFFGDLYYDIDRIIGNYTLTETFEFIDENQLDESYKSLHPYTFRTNPDEAITEVAFEKGYQFMEYMSQLIKEHNVLKLLKDFIIKYRFRTVDYKIFQAFSEVWLEQNIGLEDGEAIYEEIDWDAWMTEPGEPPKNSIQEFKSTEYDIAISMANKFVQFDGAARPQDYQYVTQWNEDMQYAFLDHFQRHAYMINVRLIRQLDELYDFKNSKDAEILYRWFSLTCLHRYNHVDNELLLDKFLSTQGRIKFVVPIYESLALSGQTQKADDYLKRFITFYHPVALEAIEAAIFRTTM